MIIEDLKDLTYEETLVYLKTFTLPYTERGKKGINRHSLLWTVTTDIETFYQNALQFTISRNML
jgi:hypothetical protein